MERIVENSAKCLKCGDKIVSKHRHDYVTCSCGNISVDGGLDYCRRSFKDMETWIDTSIWEDDIPKPAYKVTMEGDDSNGKTL
ncbi:MAG: hypothetical protein IJV94_03400 [Bacilli bacterium]|nr:hypothetical protein [Bacilli bacterium]